MTPNAYQQSCTVCSQNGVGYPVGYAAFVAEVSAGGNDLLYSTYLDGSISSVAAGLAVDSTDKITVDPVGHIYLGGYTFGVSPTTANSYPCPANGACGSYIAVLDWSAPPASQLLYGANVGGDYSLEVDSGSGGGFVSGIAADAGGNIYLSGATTDPNFPVTPDAYQSQCLACIQLQESGGVAWPDGFLSEFNPSASGSAQLVYSTFLGGSGRTYFETGDEALGIAVDPGGHVALTGYASSNNFPVSSNALQPRCLACSNGGTAGGSAAFIAEFAFPTPQFTLSPTPEMSPTPLRTPTPPPTRTATPTPTWTPTPSPTPIAPSSARLTIEPRRLNFPDEHFLAGGGETSEPKFVKLMVVGNEPVEIENATASGDFLAGRDCNGLLLPPGSACSVPFFFTPSPLGKRTGSLLITSNAVNPTETVTAVGHGIEAKLKYKPRHLHFEATTAGQTSSPKSLMLTSDNGVWILFGSITTSSNFVIVSNSCGSSLPPPHSCVIHVAFAPTAAGKAKGVLTINDDAPGAPHLIKLSGDGK